MKTTLRRITIGILVLTHLFVATGGFYGAAMLLTDTTGYSLGLPPEWLAQSGFPNYLIPGILLMFVGCLLPALSTLFILTKWKLPNFLQVFPDSHVSRSLSLITGLGLIVWIAIQQLLAPYFFLQPMISLAGWLIVVLTMLPLSAKYFD
ncbi:MAG: hypothetical protein JNM00_11610 [Flavobacteriales bacterium]|nr:hypothetical protein [Flavobacteriales bacterium]